MVVILFSNVDGIGKVSSIGQWLDLFGVIIAAANNRGVPAGVIEARRD